MDARKESTFGKMDLSVFTLATVLLLASPLTHAAAMSSAERNPRAMFYVCPPDFVRLGGSCYFFSTDMATWQDAHFACKDKDSNLTAPQRWEDRNLREYLNKPEVAVQERWLGGVYDWQSKAWKWGGEMRTMNYQSFSRMRKLPPDSLRWHCVAMVPEILYRWAPRSCVVAKHYICQAKLQKVRRADRDMLRKKWNPSGNGKNPNEISAPDPFDYEAYNSLHPNPSYNVDPNVIQINHRGQQDQGSNTNNVTPGPVVNNHPKAFVPGALREPGSTGRTAYGHLSSNERRRNATRNARRRRPFKGYRYNKADPEAAYIHNVNALRSGKTGLSNVQIEKQLRRLERMRKKEEAMRIRKERMRERQNRQRNSNNDDANILAAHPNRITSRKTIDHTKDRKNKDPKKSSHSIENVTQRTFMMDNQISALHPRTIVEVHDFSTE